MSVTSSGVTHRNWFNFGKISFEIFFGIYMTVPLVRHEAWIPACTLNFSPLWEQIGQNLRLLFGCLLITSSNVLMELCNNRYYCCHY